MAKKADLLEEAIQLGASVTESNTIAEITAAIKAASSNTTPSDQAPIETSDESPIIDAVTAKAGKRSAKGIAEAEEKAKKEARKLGESEVTENDDSDSMPSKPTHNPTRTRLERSGKKLRKASELIEAGKEYSAKEALELAIKTATTSFDSTVEFHARLNVDPRQADQNIRETLVLPAGTGKTIRVAVYGEADDVTKAKKAGADIAGAEEFLQQLDKGIIDFDVLIATPAVMPKLGKYARSLGPKGLMPNPKSGTVTKDVEKAVQQAKAGKVEFRVDSTGIIHLGIGKVSFGAAPLLENLQAVFASLKAAKPSSLKGTYINTLYITTTMGPSIKVASTEL